jgi:hypothetical protein
MWFASIRAGSLGAHDIYRATRTSFASPWNMPVHLTDVSSPGGDSSPATDASELALVLSVNSGSRHLARATRATPTDAWPEPQLVGELAMVDESAPALTPDGRTMYYAGDPTGAGTPDLYVTARATTTSPFATPARLDEVSSSASDTAPWISGTQQVLYFSSDRAGRASIYRAERR